MREQIDQAIGGVCGRGTVLDREIVEIFCSCHRGRICAVAYTNPLSPFSLCVFSDHPGGGGGEE